MTDTQFYFAYFSVYILFPLLYIITTTENFNAFVMLLRFVKSGIFSMVGVLNEFLTDVVYSVLRLFGQYAFSTYTVVKDGREIYTASSMYFFFQSDKYSVYRVDRAKYNVCKWIDKQCELYRQQYNGDEPVLNEKRNDIYDFIIHKIDDERYVRIHRGDFSARTHTLIFEHYRKFAKSYQIADTAELTICMNNDSDVDTNTDATAATPETFSITLKRPHHYFIEKNEILDKAFLQWKLYNEFGRKDVANYIRMPFSKYKVTFSYNECMKNQFPELNTLCIYELNENNSIIVGSQYIIKVDTTLRCPVLERNEEQVNDIDGVLSSYYECSDTEEEVETDTDTDTEAEADDDTDAETEAEPETETEVTTTTTTQKADDPEFEMIGGENPTQ
jgi:hypothetical protein